MSGEMSSRKSDTANKQDITTINIPLIVSRLCRFTAIYGNIIIIIIMYANITVRTAYQ